MKHNIIIAFDGPDNVGKGTQINLLRKYFKDIPFFISNLDKPVGTDDTEKINYGLDVIHNHLKGKQLLAQNNIPQIIDRMHYTEYAYSILRGGHAITTITDIEQSYENLKNNLFTIIFTDTVDNIIRRDDGMSNYKNNKLDNLKDNIEQIINRFHEISEASIFDNVIINIQGKDIKTVHNEVICRLKERFPELE